MAGAKVGILGLGGIGRVVAANLRSEGFAVCSRRAALGPRLRLASPVLQTALDWYGRLIEAGRGEDEGASIYELLRRPDPTRM